MIIQKMWLLQKQGTYIERLMDHIQMWYFGSLAVQPEFISHFPIAHRIWHENIKECELSSPRSFITQCPTSIKRGT